MEMMITEIVGLNADGEGLMVRSKECPEGWHVHADEMDDVLRAKHKELSTVIK